MKFFSVNRNHIVALVTLLAVVAVGAFYFFIYLPDNEKVIQAQRFRALQNISQNIQAKIENSAVLLNNLLDSYEDKREFDRRKGYINSSNKANFVFTDTQEISINIWRSNKNNIDSSAAIDVNHHAKDISLFFSKEYLKTPNGETYSYHRITKDNSEEIHGDTIALRVGMKFSFEQFINSLLPPKVFDQYIIFSDSGLVHETFPAGIMKVIEDSLLGFKNGISVSGVRKFTVSGQEYKLFLQPVRLGPEKNWIIGGLLTNQRYEKEKKQLPAEIVMLLVTIVLGIILLFPLIRIFQAGNKDRFTLTDGVSCIVVSMLLMSLLVLAIFKYHFSLPSDSSSNSKNILADSISAAFNREVDSIYKALYNYDSLSKNGFASAKDADSTRPPSKVPNISDRDIINLNIQPEYYNGDSIEHSLAKLLKDIGKNVSIKHLFWLDSTGKEIRKWNTDGFIPPHSNYAEREYFKRAKAENLYFLDSGYSKKFFLDQIISWTAGEFTTIMSIHSGDKVAAISVEMKSLENVLLPTGYQFAMIDNSGKVLYHSDSSRNLNENLLQEFSGKGKKSLQSSLQSHTAADFVAGYFSNQYNVKIKPITRLPYYIVIFEDIGYEETRNMEIYSFTFFMLFLFFVFVLLKLAVIFLASASQPFFKRQFYDTYWIGPKEKSHDEYILSALFNVIVTIILLLFLRISGILAYFFILLSSVCFVSLFLNGLFLSRYIKQKRRNNIQYKKRAIGGLLVMLLLVNLFAWEQLKDSCLCFIGYELAVIIIGAVIIWSQANIPDEHCKRNNLVTKYLKKLCWVKFPRWNYTNSFTVMIFTRLFLTSGIPVMFFYIIAYNYGQSIDVKYKQSKYADALVKKDQSIIDSTTKKIKNNCGVYPDNSVIANVSLVKKNGIKTYPLNAEEKSTIQFLGLFKLYITAESVNERNFYHLFSDDSLYFYKPVLTNIYCPGDSIITYRQAGLPGQYFKISSSDLYYKPDFSLSPVSWGGLLLFMLVFYFIVYKAIKKLFALKIPELTAWKRLDEKILGDNNLNNLVFVIGLPGAGKTEKILDKVKNGQILSKNNKLIGHDEFTVADLIRIPDTNNENEFTAEWKKFTEQIFNRNYKLIVVNNFEYNIQDPLTNRIKLNFLENLLIKKNTCKIIILSTIHPVAFLDSEFSQSLKKKNKSAAEDKSLPNESKSIPGEDLERWHVLLGHYRIVLLPIEKVSASSGFSNETSLNKLIINETKRTAFLNQVRKPALETSREVEAVFKEEGKELNPDEMAFKLQINSHYFYMYMWQSLTKEEKFLLYDLAEDNLVNSFDGYNLTMLVAKGIVVRKDGTLTIFNKGFRNFILTAIGNIEAMKIKAQIRDNGNWGKLRTPLMIIIFAILAFLLASQQDAYSTLITYVTTLGAGVPIVLKLFSFFDKGNAKTS